MDGAGFLPAGVPSNWTIFFGAEDVDKTLRVIADIGGAVLREAEDTPYGRSAAATDPTGVIVTCPRCRREDRERGVAGRPGPSRLISQP